MDDVALPSIKEIVASDHKLSVSDAVSTVVKVGEQFAVKYGRRVSPLEAENLRYLANTAVPVPKIYGFMTDPQTNRSFIIMELIEGKTLEKILPSLSSADRRDVFEQIQDALVHLRSLQPPGYIGSVGRKPLADGIFYTEPLDPTTSGPFASQDEMNEGIIRRLAETCVPSHVALLRNLIESTLHGHRTVFTHADLQPKNIMVARRKDADQVGRSTFAIKIIDWEMSGWYPEYYEFCNATVWDSSKPEWLEAVQKIMTVYPKEYLMLKLIRSIVFLLG